MFGLRPWRSLKRTGEAGISYMLFMPENSWCSWYCCLQLLASENETLSLHYSKYWCCELISISGVMELLADVTLADVCCWYLSMCPTKVWRFIWGVSVLPSSKAPAPCRNWQIRQVYSSCVIVQKATDLGICSFILVVNNFDFTSEGMQGCYSVWDDFFNCFLTSRQLTIGQMQGKFQMIVVRHTGHAIQVLFLKSWMYFASDVVP